MFQYLRSHRRTGSTPTSPQPQQWSPSFPQAEFHDSPAFSFASGAGSQASPAIDSPISPLPPVLPPIPRIASRGEHDRNRQASPKLRPAQKSEDSAIPRLSIPKPPHARPQTHSDSYTLPNIPRIASKYDTESRSAFHRETQSADGAEENDYVRTGLRKPGRPGYRGQDSLSSPSDVDLECDSNKALSAGPSQHSRDTSHRPTTPSDAIPQHDGLLVPNATHRASSPTSSFSSVQRTPSSTNINHEYSPASSKSIHPPQYSAPQPKPPTKSKSKLLNPVTSFLKKRKTSQGSENIPEHELMPRNTDIPAVGLPDDWDPRIKGKGVHDFNAPRPRRNFSVAIGQGPGPIITTTTTQDENNRQSAKQESGSVDIEKDKTPEKEHTPVFVENFGEDEYEQDESAVKRESLANPQFLARMSRQLDFEVPDAYDLTDQTTPAAHQEKNNKPGDNRTSSDHSTIRSSTSNETKATSPPQSPLSRQSRVSLDPPFQPAGLPKHFKSSASQASRFSFQMGTESSAVEEKALEEKHKQKTRANRASTATAQDYVDSDEEDPSMYDDMYDDFEERIPGVNVDEEDEYPGMGNAQLPIRTIKQSYDTQLSPSGQDSDAAKSLISGLGLMQLQEMAPSNDISRQPSSGPVRSDTQYSALSEGMYFDDGMIDSPGDEEHNEFDETVFDSPVNQSFNPQRSSHFSAALLDEVSRQSEDMAPSRSDYGDETVVVKQADSETHDQQPPPSNHLSAYHNALASAANKAAADGKFYRQNSLSDYGDDVGLQDIDNDIGRQDWDDDNFPDDDIALEDDPMVAAANAEALAADDSGFYGTEFGFYKSSQAGDDQFYSGGYFGNPLMQAAMISREPNLTPITERSEFSTRNSFVSVGQFGPPGSSHGVPLSGSLPREPGLKELAANMGADDDEMTLSQLIKLRKEAFGSSHSHSNSLGSNSSSQSSPNTNLSGPFPARNPNLLAPTQEESSDDQQGNSSYDESEGFDDGYDSPNSPTITMANPVRLSAGSAHEISSDSKNYSNFSDYWDSPKMPPPPKPFAKNQASYNKPQPFPHTSQDIILPSNAAQIPPTSSSHSIPVAAPIAAPPILSDPIPGLNQAPMPSSSVLAKLNARPHASAYSNYHRRTSSQGDKERGSAGSGDRDRDRDSVTYVRGDESEGGGWYVERRRTMDTGEVVVLGRELVEGGRI